MPVFHWFIDAQDALRPTDNEQPNPPDIAKQKLKKVNYPLFVMDYKLGSRIFAVVLRKATTIWG